MKICPECNESFTDEFSFCELDGTKLKRQSGATAEPGAKKDWSLLGLALVLGAVLITVATIILAPKARYSPSTGPSDSVAAVASPPQTLPATSAMTDTTPSGGTDTPPASDVATGDETLLPGESKKKEKAVKPESDESADAAKAAARLSPSPANPKRQRPGREP
jgi:cytoskeletal protein RodZ